MLKPYVCVVCEKVIFGQDSVPSLINLFTKITATIPVDAPEIPKNAVAPKEWCVFSSWDAEPGDELREYFICTHVLYPDQTPFGEISKNKLNIELGKRAQFNVQMLGFPMGQAGVYTVKTWIEENQRTVVGPLELKIELVISRQGQAQ